MRPSYWWRFTEYQHAIPRARLALSICICLLLVACADQGVEEATPTPSVEGTTAVGRSPTEAVPDSTATASSTTTDPLPGPTATAVPSPTASQTPGVMVENTDAYKQLPEITISIESALLASPNHPTAYLPSDPIPAGGQVRLLGIDSNGAWLLVLHNNTMGWIPSFYSNTSIGTLKVAVVGDPLSGRCVRYLGGMITPDEVWVSGTSGPVAVQGLIYRPEPAESNEAASLAIEIEGAGEVVTPETTLAPVAGSQQVYLFTFAAEDLEAQSRIKLRLMGIEHEPLAFQAAFFSTTCSGETSSAQSEAQPFTGDTTDSDSLVMPTPVVIKIRLGPQSSSRASTSEPSSETRGKVLDVLRRYEAERILSHGPSHDISGLKTVLAKDSLTEHLSRVKWQRNNNAYYAIQVHESHVVEMSAFGTTRVDALVDKVESREFYINGRLGSENTVYNDHYQVRYHLELIGGAWYIVDRTVILPTSTTTGTAGGVSAPAPDPTKKPTASAPSPLVSNVRDFSGTQGAKGWKYLFEEGRNSGLWRDMQFGDYDGKQCWLTGTWEGDVRICAQGQVHPGHSTRIAYEWRPDQEQDIRIKVHAHKVDTGCGDGVSVETYRAIDGQGMVERLGSFRIGRSDTTGKTENYNTRVARGMLIYVIVDIYGNSQCDATKLLVEIY